MEIKLNKILGCTTVGGLVVSLLAIDLCGTSEDVLVRNRRQLLFPNSSLLQFNVGIGTPSPAEKININWAFQANFQLPWNRSQIPSDILEANSGYVGLSRRKREDTVLGVIEEDGGYQSDAKLYHFYKFLGEILDGFGENGTSCVLRMFCQLSAEPLHTDNEDDLLHEIANYVLNPNNDVTHGNNNYKDESHPYIQAHREGSVGKDCAELYKTCTTPLVDIFSQLY